MDLSKNLQSGEDNVPAFDQYLNMINLKTSVLLAASLKMGSVLGGAGERNQDLLYEFGRKLGLAFQVQDDYLDAFGDPDKFGKKTGGDINTNKKTFLLIHAFTVADGDQKRRLMELLSSDSDEKVDDVLEIFRECKVDEWARELKQRYTEEAFKHLEDVAVLSKRKDPLKQMAEYLTQREN
jgi:geranylgeranyl diphosphate synthase type II